MLLRSINQHVKDQNWFAVALDFFIVVTGILIAFQITNWNEDRQDIREETALKVRLVDEFGALEELLLERIARAEKIAVGTRTLIELVRQQGEPSEEIDVNQLLIHAFKYNAQIAPPTTFSEAIQSGRIGNIRDDDLRRALNEYQVSTGWWSSVRGPSNSQIDPNSKLNQAVTIHTGVETIELKILDYDWDVVTQAEKELSVIGRRQGLQAEGYRLELDAVRRVLIELTKK